MSAKLIFSIDPKSEKKTFQLCPLVEVGCGKCFLPSGCKGEHDKNVAFRLRLKNGHYWMTAIYKIRSQDAQTHHQIKRSN